MGRGEKATFLQYKFSEMEIVWRPNHRLNNDSTWEIDDTIKGWNGVLHDIPARDIIPTLEPKNDNWGESSVKAGVMRLNRVMFPNWRDDFFQDWVKFWTDFNKNEPSIPWLFPTLLGSIETERVDGSITNQSNLNQSSPMLNRYLLGQDQVAEPLVCGSGSEQAQWARDREEARINARCTNLAPVAVLSRVKVGEFLAFFADEESKKEDATNGYHVPFNIARVEAVDVSSETVDIVWMFAKSTDDVFSEWKLEPGSLLEEKDKAIQDFCQATLGGDVIKVKLTSMGRLTK